MNLIFNEFLLILCKNFTRMAVKDYILFKSKKKNNLFIKIIFFNTIKIYKLYLFYL
jgi:hypothetical protein